jgi:hypothetical protein
VYNVHRPHVTDCIFFVNVNLRPRIKRFNESEYALIIDVLEASRRRLGFLLCGNVLMPDHGHALIWPQFPLLIWLVGTLREAPQSPSHAISQERFANRPYITPGKAAGERNGNTPPRRGIALCTTRRKSTSAWITCT